MLKPEGLMGGVDFSTEEHYAMYPELRKAKQAIQALIQSMLDIPELQSEWEEDIHGCPNPNGKAKNELRAEIRTAIKLIGGSDE